VFFSLSGFLLVNGSWSAGGAMTHCSRFIESDRAHRAGPTPSYCADPGSDAHHATQAILRHLVRASGCSRSRRAARVSNPPVPRCEARSTVAFQMTLGWPGHITHRGSPSARSVEAVAGWQQQRQFADLRKYKFLIICEAFRYYICSRVASLLSSGGAVLNQVDRNRRHPDMTETNLKERVRKRCKVGRYEA
jgi:hypothetical protein